MGLSISAALDQCYNPWKSRDTKTGMRMRKNIVFAYWYKSGVPVGAVLTGAR